MPTPKDPRQLDLPLVEPEQPECLPGMRVRVMQVGFRQLHPGAPVEHPVRVYDGILKMILPAGEHPPGPPYFKPRQLKSKYDRWVMLCEKINGRPAWRFGAQKGYKIEVITIDKKTKAFRYDLCE